MSRRYEPPMAADLSAASASGQGPLGVCKTGQVPHYDCFQGPAFVANCSFGSGVDTSACSLGGYHTYPTCNTGSLAATICVSGMTQN